MPVDCSVGLLVAAIISPNQNQFPVEMVDGLNQVLNLDSFDSNSL